MVISRRVFLETEISPIFGKAVIDSVYIIAILSCVIIYCVYRKNYVLMPFITSDSRLPIKGFLLSQGIIMSTIIPVGKRKAKNNGGVV